MTFRVGMKVVCVDVEDLHDGGNILNGFAPTNLRCGLIYEIDWLGIRGGCLCVRLAGVKRNSKLYADTPFKASRFRPAVSPKSEVSFTTGAPIDSERWDNRRRVVEPMPVDGWRVGV